MTRAHTLLKTYLEKQFPDAKLTALDNDKMVIAEASGKQTTFTLNIYGDIMDAHDMRIVAYSNVPHTMEWLLMNMDQLPTEWVNNAEYYKYRL